MGWLLMLLILFGMFYLPKTALMVFYGGILAWLGFCIWLGVTKNNWAGLIWSTAVLCLLAIFAIGPNL